MGPANAVSRSVIWRSPSRAICEPGCTECKQAWAMAQVRALVCVCVCSRHLLLVSDLTPCGRQRVSSVQGFEDIVAAADLNETEDQKLRSKKMQKIGYKGNDAIEADEVSCSAVR